MGQEIERLNEQLRALQTENECLLDEISDLQIENEDLHIENEDLAEREALALKLIEQAPDAFFVHDLEGRFIFVNEVCCQCMGYTKEELLGLSVTDVEVGKSVEQMRQCWAEVNSGKTVHTEGLLKRKDGSTFPVDICIGLFNASGNKVIYGVGRDISDRKQFEERLRHAHKMEAVGTLAGGVAHDFNNILAIILGCSELAGDPLLDDHPSREYLKEIKSAVLRAKEVTQQLLSFSQKSEQARVPLPIAPLVKDSLRLMQATISANIELQADISNDCFLAMANPSQIHQVMINLCANAAHATRDGGTIEVGLKNRIYAADSSKKNAGEPFGHYLQLTIRDTGSGMTPEIIERIFDPYFTTKDVGKGTGMGLAVVHGIVQSLGGTIRVESEPGRGSVFEVLLPAVEEQEQPTYADETPTQSPPLGDERVIVVDDEALIVEGLKQRLEVQGYVVEGFDAPLDALAAITKNPRHFDLLITDMAMPKMTGDMLIAKVKQIRHDLPVILCTGYSERIDGKAPEEVGAAKIMLKPIDRGQLAVSVRQVLDRAQAKGH
jgi:PAS domain S-box-containing protein